MRSDIYRDALPEVAAGSRGLDQRVKDHMEECPQCRMTLQRERMLFAAIDRALRVRVKEEPGAVFFANVRARIARDPEPRSLSSPIWALAVASVIVASSLAVPWGRLRKQPPTAEGPPVLGIRIQPAPQIAEPRMAATTHGPNQPIQKGPVARNAHRGPEVLVPPDEREALARFVTHLRQGDEVARTLIGPAVDQNDKLPEIPPVEIARLQLKPLVWESWK